MKLRALSLFACSALILTLVVFTLQKPSELRVLEWSAKGAKDSPPLAVLIEFGRKDAKPTSWSGSAAVQGATVVHREGYRFHKTDKLSDPNGWEASSHQAPAKANPAQAAMEGMARVGVVLHLADIKPGATLTITAGKDHKPATVAVADLLSGSAQQLWDGFGEIRLITTATPVVAANTEDSFPAAAYGPDGTLWLAYISYALKDESRRVSASQLKGQPRDFKAFDTLEYGDQLFVKAFRDGKWGNPVAVTDAKQDLVGCAIAVEGNGTVWAFYSSQRDGRNKLLARSLNPANMNLSAEQALVPTGVDPERQVDPVACTENDGTVRVACQTWRPDNTAVISTWRHVNGAWRAMSPSATPRRAWHPSLATGPKKESATAYDTYSQGDYDIYVRTEPESGGDAVELPVAFSPRFEARPSLAYDTQGRLWIAHEVGPENWGKDWGNLDSDRGNSLYNMRTVRVVCVQDGKLFKPTAELPPLGAMGKDETPSKINEARTRYSHPQIGIDGKGRIWLTYVQKFGTRASTKLGSYWLTMARRLDGDHWSAPIEVHHSDGMMDPRPVLLPHSAGGLRIIHHADGRFTTPDNIDNQIYMSYLDLPGDPIEPKLEAAETGAKDDKDIARVKSEREDLARIRAYKLEAGAKSYRLLRGEFHRHTEISGDGGSDGSLLDMWRYAIDAADLDWIGNTDHDNGNGREYTWWQTQKRTDAYHVASHFTPLFAYERSVSYPHGHRNVIFPRRGIRTLPRLAPPEGGPTVAGIHADDAKMLFRYLHELGGICASHTSATTMGTDWRDNDPAVEPLVEIYQGDRNSYEKEAAPRAGFDAKSGKLPVQIAGWHPDGFVDVAMNQKKYKFAFESSSDHLSTHISYSIVLAEKHDRDSIFAAMKKRHCYAATDNIILDVKSGANVMGDEFKSAGPPRLEIKAIGTANLKKLEILRDSQVVATFEPGRRDYETVWTDPKPSDGEHYYYVRVVQADGQMAWGSPMWITLGK